MKRFTKILGLAIMSPVLIAAPACTMTGDGWSFFAPISFSSIPFIGTFL